VVRARAATAQDDVAVAVAGGGDHGSGPGRGDAEERVRGGGGPAGVDRDLGVAVGAVLEAHRHGQAGGQLAVNLAFGGAGADGAPGHGVGDVLRGDRVE